VTGEVEHFGALITAAEQLLPPATAATAATSAHGTPVRPSCPQGSGQEGLAGAAAAAAPRRGGECLLLPPPRRPLCPLATAPAPGAPAAGGLGPVGGAVRQAASLARRLLLGLLLLLGGLKRNGVLCVCEEKEKD